MLFRSGDDHLADGQVGGNAEHDRGHDLLHDSPQTAGADLTLHRLLGDALQGLGLDLQLHMIELQQLLILPGQCILGLRQNTNQILLGEAVEARDDGQSAHQLRDL